MIRALLPAALSLAATYAHSQGTDLRLLESPPSPPAPCTAKPGDPANCTRILACIGKDGLWFDGRAYGWNAGTLNGQISDGSTCTEEWRSGMAFGTGRWAVSCSDGSSGQVIYYIEHNETGTVEGRGLDTKGRALHVWTGLNVLEFLKDATGIPRLKCGPTDIPIS
ncbi:MAG TPA: hypothetical protein DCX13_08150 [Rhodobacteraceae bacterium]|jgi:hypothetical protein|nr:hypothetical protein [Paracoccaceae bacterium]